MTSTRRVAINPLPWILHEVAYKFDGSVLRQALSELGAIGYRALTVEIPVGWSTTEYRDTLESFGFSPAPGYFSADWSDVSTHAATVERAKQHAADHAELGLDCSFIAHDLTELRLAQPAIGAGLDRALLGPIADGLALAAEAAEAEGVRFALHPHVASLIETEEEVRAILDSTAGSALQFGPDTGHLFWAGADPAALMADYTDRIIALHLKDVDADARAESLRAGDDYLAATGVRKIWTEPGRGAIDFDAVFASLPEDYSGWSVIEVDVPNLPTAEASSAASFDFTTRHPFFASADDEMVTSA